MSKPAIDHRDRLEELNGKLANLGMRGYWQLRHDADRMEPKLWRWTDIYPAHGNRQRGPHWTRRVPAECWPADG